MRDMPTNLFEPTPDALADELFETLIETQAFKLERIVSAGHATPPGQWYDQERAEWVVLLSGSAALRFEGEAGARILRPGDHVLIPAHRRHRVEWTDPVNKTVWLALHYGVNEGLGQIEAVVTKSADGSRNRVGNR
jgi:cupin 2 domain-containing protein